MASDPSAEPPAPAEEDKKASSSLSEAKDTTIPSQTTASRSQVATFSPLSLLITAFTEVDCVCGESLGSGHHAQHRMVFSSVCCLSDVVLWY